MSGCDKTQNDANFDEESALNQLLLDEAICFGKFVGKLRISRSMKIHLVQYLVQGSQIQINPRAVFRQKKARGPQNEKNCFRGPKKWVKVPKYKKLHFKLLFRNF